jgi:hypothetical protein
VRAPHRPGGARIGYSVVQPNRSVLNLWGSKVGSRAKVAGFRFGYERGYAAVVVPERFRTVSKLYELWVVEGQRARAEKIGIRVAKLGRREERGLDLARVAALFGIEWKEPAYQRDAVETMGNLEEEGYIGGDEHADAPSGAEPGA